MTSSVVYFMPPIAVAATAFVGAALEPGLLSRCLSWRPLVWLGVISYSLYLWHLLVFWLFQWQHPWIALLVTLVVATACYYAVERPLRKALHARRAQEPRAEGTQPAPARAWNARPVYDGEPRTTP